MATDLKTFEKYAELARSLGAVDALVIAAADVVVDGRTYLEPLTE